jgi:hypothetical protein
MRTYPHISPTRGFIHDDEPLPARERMHGHPTSPGARDGYAARVGSPDFADGTPGLPRVQPTPMTHTGGTPGSMPGPKEIEVFYDGPTDLPNGAR